MVPKERNSQRAPPAKQLHHAAERSGHGPSPITNLLLTLDKEMPCNSIQQQ